MDKGINGNRKEFHELRCIFRCPNMELWATQALGPAPGYIIYCIYVTWMYAERYSEEQ